MWGKQSVDISDSYLLWNCLQFPFRYLIEERNNQWLTSHNKTTNQTFPFHTTETITRPQLSAYRLMLIAGEMTEGRDVLEVTIICRFKAKRQLHIFKYLFGNGWQTARKIRCDMAKQHSCPSPGPWPCARSCCWSQVESSGWWHGIGGGPVGRFCPWYSPPNWPTVPLFHKQETKGLAYSLAEERNKEGLG